MSEQGTVRLCRVGIKARPREWDKLSQTAHEDVRHCAACDRDVHFCATDADTIAKARAGFCIARWEPHPDSVPKRHVVLGRPNVSELPDESTPDEKARMAAVERERGIAQALARVDFDTVACAQCGYPLPTFRKTCYVCRTPLR